MRFRYSFTAQLILALALFAAVIGLVRFASYKNFPIMDDIIKDTAYGRIVLARPLISFKALAVVFADNGKFPAQTLAHRIAKTGVAVAVVDSGRAIQALTDNKTHCITTKKIKIPFALLEKWSKAPKKTLTILAGIDTGSLLPFINAATRPDSTSMNISVGFSAVLPKGTDVCTPLSSKPVNGHRQLASFSPFTGKWLAAWTDQPDDATAVFVRKLTNIRTDIAPYNTPLESVMINEIHTIIDEQQKKTADLVPTVALPSKSPNRTVTFFYSGDGGWRDLDRDVGGIMADRGYPVVGVDTLRYFWSSKTVEEVAQDLSAMMKKYRSSWKAKRFVLAGYSFGADILPAVYNHLPETDRKDVNLIVLLALGKAADFEIHVSGWLGKSSTGFPILPELNRIPGKKVLCIYGQEEKDDTACTEYSAPGAQVVQLPGGHHFDHNYQKLVMRLITAYNRIGMDRAN